jgi:hypothetical protein
VDVPSECTIVKAIECIGQRAGEGRRESVAVTNAKTTLKKKPVRDNKRHP